MRHIQPQICQHGFVVVFLLFSLPGHGARNSPTPGYELKAQQPVSVESGLCVEIPCTFSANKTLSKNVTGIWRRTDISDIVAASTDASKVSETTKGRFTLIGKVHEGNCSFSISKAQPEDQGEYVFRFEDGDHKYSYSWNQLNVTVTIIDLPEPTISPVGKLIAGEQITLTCTSHPAPQGCKGNITWEGRINISNTNNYERKDQAGKVSSISNITFTPSQGDHKSSLTCTVTYSEVSTNSSITLDVEYAPRSPTILNYTSASMNCTSAGCRFEVIEGTSLSLLCSAESNPPANLSWAKQSQNSADPLNSSSGRLEVSHVTNDNEGDYICQATNKHGHSTLSNTVVMIYAPKRLTIKSCNINGCSVYDEHSSVEVFEGNSLYLQCVAQSNPVANVSWIKHTQNSTVIQTSPTLHLNVTKAAFENGGNYTCRAMNIVGNESKSIFVVIKSPTNDAFHLVGSFCGILVLLLTVIVITAFMVKKYKQRRRPPEQAKENENSPPNNSEVVYSNIERRNIAQKHNTSLSSPNECKNPDEDLQYVTLDFSRSKPNTSREPQETLYSEVRRN